MNSDSDVDEELKKQDWRLPFQRHQAQLGDIDDWPSQAIDRAHKQILIGGLDRDE